ncbi:large-conductance mechanosensitive channel [Gemmatimonadetes bacterium T265]|nr:large-conductance mechanosensitive channel [Gemmatimonadetes bacterium T265]
MWRDFKAFLIKQNALALAIAVVVGGALDTVVKAIVNGILMPFIGPLQQATGGDYAKLTWHIGPFLFAPGVVLAALVNFVIIGFVAWRLSKLFVKETPTSPTKTCPVCFKSDLDERATRCPHCTSALDATTQPVPVPPVAPVGRPAPALAR